LAAITNRVIHWGRRSLALAAVGFQAVEKIRTSGSPRLKGVVMHTKLVVLGLIFTVSAASTAHSQVTVDVSKINCDQFVHHKVATPNVIAAWFSGYYNAKRNNRIIDLDTLDENVSKVKNYCSDEKNFKVPVMKAVEQVLGKGK
jgi:hypothetical protein